MDQALAEQALLGMMPLGLSFPILLAAGDMKLVSSFAFWIYTIKSFNIFIIQNQRNFYHQQAQCRRLGCIESKIVFGFNTK